MVTQIKYEGKKIKLYAKKVNNNSFFQLQRVFKVHKESRKKVPPLMARPSLDW